MINPISGIRQPFDIDYDISLQGQESAVKAQKSVDDYYDLLSRANMQSGDSLDSYLDNVIATKSALANKDYIYEDTIEEATEAYFNNISQVDSVTEMQEIGISSKSESKNNPELSNILLANIIDVIMYSKLLHDRFPLGITRFFMRPKLPGRGAADKRSIKAVPFSERRDIINFELSFYRRGKMKYKVDIRFNIQQNTITMWVNKEEVSAVRFSLEKGVVRAANGRLFNRPFLLRIRSISARRNSALYLIGKWKTEQITSAHNLEDGVWRHKITGAQKMFKNKITQFENTRKENLVLQSIHIGEDQCMMLYRFAPGLIFPLFASGVIVNRNPISAPRFSSNPLKNAGKSR